MNRPSHTPINDELLSAYIDGLVTTEEKAQVEAAVGADPVLAWELETLRQTVELVRSLPPVALPRSFALRQEEVADVLTERQTRAAGPVGSAPERAQRQLAKHQESGFWQEFLAFFNSGNLLLRNATAVAALFLVIVLVTTPSSPNAAQTATAPVAERSSA